MHGAMEGAGVIMDIKEEPLDAYEDCEVREMEAGLTAAHIKDFANERAAIVKSEMADDMDASDTEESSSFAESLHIVEEAADIITVNAAESIDEHTFNKQIQEHNEIFKKRKKSTYRDVCPRCQQSFDVRRIYEQHLEYGLCAVYENKQRCVMCPMSFGTKLHLEEHLELHRLNRFFCIKHCGVDFKTLDECVDHEFGEHHVRIIFCNICRHKFSTSDGYLEHTRQQHANLERFICSHCREWFSSSGLLQEHWRLNPAGCGRLMRNVLPQMHANNKTPSRTPPIDEIKTEFDTEMDVDDEIKVKQEPLDMDDYLENGALEAELEIKTELETEPEIKTEFETDVEIKTEPILNLDEYYEFMGMNDELRSPPVEAASAELKPTTPLPTAQSGVKLAPNFMVKTTPFGPGQFSLPTQSVQMLNNAAVPPLATGTTNSLRQYRPVKIFKLASNAKIVRLPASVGPRIVPNTTANALNTKNSTVIVKTLPAQTTARTANRPGVQHSTGGSQFLVSLNSLDPNTTIDENELRRLIADAAEKAIEEVKRKRTAALANAANAACPTQKPLIVNLNSIKAATSPSKLKVQKIEQLVDDPHVSMHKVNISSVGRQDDGEGASGSDVSLSLTMQKVDVPSPGAASSGAGGSEVTLSLNSIGASLPRDLTILPILNREKPPVILNLNSLKSVKMVPMVQLPLPQGATTRRTASGSPKGGQRVSGMQITLALDSLDASTTIKEDNLKHIIAKAAETAIQEAKRKHTLSRSTMGEFENRPDKRKIIDSIVQQMKMAEMGIQTNCRSAGMAGKSSIKAESSADESVSTAECFSESSRDSQLSRQEDPPTSTTLPSLYLPIATATDPELSKMRRLHKDYRYLWMCPLCSRQYELKHPFRGHLVSAHGMCKEEFDKVMIEVKPIPNLVSSVVTGSEISKAEPFQAQQQQVSTPVSPASVPASASPSAATPGSSTTAGAPEVPIKYSVINAKKQSQAKSRYVCNKCGRNYSSKSMLSDHIRGNCSREPQYPCTQCSKKFYSASTLNCHMSIHTGELPHKCSFCDKRFRTRGQVTVHHRTHTGERPFVCQVCSQSFTHRETLISHLSRHIGMKRYKCYGCDKLFSCISGLRTHRMIRPDSCGKVKFNSRAVGPRVRVIRGHVMFEPQPDINPYLRTEDPQDVLAEIQNQQNN